MTLRKSIIAAAYLLVTAAVACSGSPPLPETSTPLAEAIQSVETPSAIASVAIPTATSVPTATATSTPVPPTQTPVPTSTAAPIPTPTIAPTATTLPSVEPIISLDSRLDTIGERTAELRELPMLKDLEREMVSREELRQMLEEDLEEDTEDIEDGNRLYTLLGIIEPGNDLGKILVDLYSESILGFFDPETEMLTIVRDKEEFTPIDELTFAHELVHGLQQQHFDIHSLGEELEDNSDQSLALSALIEGDATLGMIAYMFRHMDDEQQQQIVEEAETESDSDEVPAPPFIERTMAFPYTEGFDFAFQLFSQSFEWSEFNNAFERIPKSTEQILHIEKYLSDELPVEVDLPDISKELGDGWSLDLTDVMGEFSYRSYLELHLEEDDARLAAEGWGGDKYALYGNPDVGDLLVMKSKWDTQKDANELFDAFVHFSEVRSGIDAETETGPPTFRIELPDQIIWGTLNEDEVVLVFAPDEQTLVSARTLLVE